MVKVKHVIFSVFSLALRANILKFNTVKIGQRDIFGSKILPATIIVKDFNFGMPLSKFCLLCLAVCTFRYGRVYVCHFTMS